MLSHTLEETPEFLEAHPEEEQEEGEDQDEVLCQIVSFCAFYASRSHNHPVTGRPHPSPCAVGAGFLTMTD